MKVFMKRCSTCKEYKDFSEFSRHSRTKGGLKYDCRACAKAHRLSPEHVRQISLAYRNTPKGRAVALLKYAQRRATEKGNEFTLTEEWLTPIIAAGVCQATGLEFVLNAGDGQHRPWTPSLDRRENSRGYTPDNTQVVCWAYNAAKGVGTDADVLKLARALCKTTL